MTVNEEPHGDVTGREKAAQSQRDIPPQPSEHRRVQNAFLAHMRHELRTPINAIIGYCEMLLEDVTALLENASDWAQENFMPDLQKIHMAGNQLLVRVNDLLDPSTLEAGQRDLDLEAFGARVHHELRTPATSIIGYCELLLEDAAALGDAGLIPGLQSVRPDLEKIRAAAQRLLALIDDLVHFSRRQAGALDLNEQAPDTSAMIQDVITAIHPLQESGAETPPAGQGAVLVVDDNEINRDVLSRRLERQGHAVAVAENGRRALEMLTSRTFDLVLLDIVMPELNGYQVLQHLKAHPTLRDIPVIMISALDELDSVVRCIELGAEDYLSKPFNPVLLGARIGACLEKKRLRDQEVEYLRNVGHVTTAAAAVEAGAFEPETLAGVAARRDELGQLARVFQRMAREIQAREERLRQQVQELRIEIDDVKKARQVAEITDTDYFQQLQEKARRLRGKTGD